ncbi:TPA: hypothetical protein ACWZ15_005128, partial [Escherichia coli]
FSLSGLCLNSLLGMNLLVNPGMLSPCLYNLIILTCLFCVLLSLFFCFERVSANPSTATSVLNLVAHISPLIQWFAA